MKKLIYTIFSLLLLFSCNKEIDTKNTGSYKDGLYHLSFDGGLGSDTKSLLNNSDNRFMNLYTEVYSECENLDSPETKHFYSEDGLFNWETLGNDKANLVVAVFNKKNGTHLKWGAKGTDLFSNATTTIDASISGRNNWADITSVSGISESQISNANYADPVYCFAPYTDSTKISVDPSDNKNLIAEFKMPVSFIFEDSQTLQALKQYSYIYTTSKIAELPTTSPKKFKASESVFKAIPAIIKINLTNGTTDERTLISISVAARDQSGNDANVFPIKLKYKIDKNGISPLTTDVQDKRSGMEVKFRGSKNSSNQTVFPTIANNETKSIYLMTLPNEKDFQNISLYFTVTTLNGDHTSYSYSQFIVKRSQIQLGTTGENKFKSGGIYTFNFTMKEENEYVENYKPETLLLSDHNLKNQYELSPTENYNDNVYISYDDFRTKYSSNDGRGQKIITISNGSYYIPTMPQYQALFPVRLTYGTATNETTLETLSKDPSRNNFCLKEPGNVSINEFMNVTQGISDEKIYRVMADYKTGKYKNYNALYAIKKKRGTKEENGIEPFTSDMYRCAYMYFFEKNNNNQEVLKVRMKYLGEFSPYTIDDVASTDFWDDGTPYFFTRDFCCRPKDDKGTTAWYWSTTYHTDGSGNTKQGQEMLCIDPEKGYVGIFDRQTPSSMTGMIRLFQNN